MKKDESVGLKNTKNKINMGVFIPSFVICAGAVILGLVSGETFAAVTKEMFTFILGNFGWLFQVVSIATLVLAIAITLSKFGKIRFGGSKAKAKISFRSWVMMAIMGGIATGLITWGVNEPLVYFGNIYGELDKVGIEPQSMEAVFFSIGRCFYNWSFFPYSMYSIAGLLLAYLYFNKGKELTIAASVSPILGERITKSWVAHIINTLALIAIALGLAAAFGAGLTLVSTGISYKYNIPGSVLVWGTLATVITAIFTFSAYTGLDKGIKWLADLKGKIFFTILILIFIAGPTLYILDVSLMGLGTWLTNFFNWSMDSGIKGGSALVHWWTLYDWAIWIAYAPLMGIFFAMISYGRTIRQFMFVNWIIPSLVGIAWFSIWGISALHMQQNGIDLVGYVQENGAVSGMWMFIDNMSFFGIKLGWLFIPVMIFTLSLSLIVAAQSTVASVSSLCTKDYDFNVEPPGILKIVWGVIIGAIGFILIASVGGEQGVDGVKYMSAVSGFAVLVIFILQILSVVKTFFMEKIVTEPIIERTHFVDDIAEEQLVDIEQHTIEH